MIYGVYLGKGALAGTKGVWKGSDMPSDVSPEQPAQKLNTSLPCKLAMTWQVMERMGKLPLPPKSIV